MTHPKPRPGILDIDPYVGGEGRAGADAQRLARLASNENPLGCSDRAREAYMKAASDIHRYPDGAAAALRKAIAEKYKIDPARVVCGNGSSELISLLASAYAGEGDEVVYSQYGFMLYPISALGTGATPVAAPEKNLRTDIEAMLGAVTDKTKIMFLANPNNPTGSYLTAAEMRELCERLPKDVLLVIDAAYDEFVEASDYESGQALVDKYENVALLRTFSKVHGLAALRLGWGYFPAHVADVLNRLRGAFNVSAAAQAAGIAALSDDAFIAQSVKTAKEGREYLSRELAALGVKCMPSQGNFLLAEFGENAEDIRLALREKGVFIRQMGAYGLPRHLRISTGTPDDNRQCIEALKKILKP